MLRIRKKLNVEYFITIQKDSCSEGTNNCLLLLETEVSLFVPLIVIKILSSVKLGTILYCSEISTLGQEKVGYKLSVMVIPR